MPIQAEEMDYTSPAVIWHRKRTIHVHWYLSPLLSKPSDTLESCLFCVPPDLMPNGSFLFSPSPLWGWVVFTCAGWSCRISETGEILTAFEYARWVSDLTLPEKWERKRVILLPARHCLLSISQPGENCLLPHPHVWGHGGVERMKGWLSQMRDWLWFVYIVSFSCIVLNRIDKFKDTSWIKDAVVCYLLNLTPYCLPCMESAWVHQNLILCCWCTAAWLKM